MPNTVFRLYYQSNLKMLLGRSMNYIVKQKSEKAIRPSFTSLLEGTIGKFAKEFGKIYKKISLGRDEWSRSTVKHLIQFCRKNILRDVACSEQNKSQLVPLA